MSGTYCGKVCEDCAYQEQLQCRGCMQGPGRSMGGECRLADCCRSKDLWICAGCSSRAQCDLMKQCADLPRERLQKQQTEEAARSVSKERAIRFAPVLNTGLKALSIMIIPFVLVELMVEWMYLGAGIPGLMVAACSLAYAVLLLRLAKVERSYAVGGLLGIGAALVDVAVALVVSTSTELWTLLLTTPVMLLRVGCVFFEGKGHGVILNGLDNALANRWKWITRLHITYLVGDFICIFLGPRVPVVSAFGMTVFLVMYLCISLLKLISLYNTYLTFRAYYITYHNP